MSTEPYFVLIMHLSVPLDNWISNDNTYIYTHTIKNMHIFALLKKSTNYHKNVW
jgi:hypothetical protein